MSRIAALTIAILALLSAGLATASVASAEDEGVVYQRYADIRERLQSCLLDSQNGWDTQTEDDKADCRRVQRYYVLYGWTGEGYVLHVHCRSASHCIPTPYNEPAADGPYPPDALIMDLTIPRESAHRKKRKHHRRHHKARSRRSRAAHGSAAVVR